ncbi:helix-turn-helix domain-containing protein [Streptococcus suis]|uniref:Helix-turn-helix domain-containing protein n=1 Tax=Streptococcus suis TaxID=1307 RepID=A0A6L8MWY8_STRSU|nr:helix-turn-helix domain-containing protein [Streptococcus suis]
MRQKSIGEVLRSARESRGWNLIDVQRMTKIQAKYLQALEYNDFEYIPDSNYIESFLVTYADALELDSAVLLDAYKKNSLVIYYEEGEEEELSTELKRRYKLRKKNKKDSFLPLFYLLLAAGLMIIFVTFVIHSRMKQISLFSNQSASYSVTRQVTNSSNSIASTSTTGNVIEESSSNSSTSSSATSASEMIQVTGSGESISATVSKITYPIDITVTADNTTSWISLSDTTLSGGVTLTPDNPSATTKIEEGVSSATLILGVVKGVTITIGGQKLDTSALTTQTGSITLYFEQ